MTIHPKTGYLFLLNLICFYGFHLFVQIQFIFLGHPFLSYRVPHHIHLPVQAHRAIILFRPAIARDKAARARVHIARPQVLPRPQAGPVSPLPRIAVIARACAVYVHSFRVGSVVTTRPWNRWKIFCGWIKM